MKTSPKDHVSWYSDSDVLHDYLLMAEDTDQNNSVVTAYRNELEKRGYTFVTVSSEELDEMERVKHEQLLEDAREAEEWTFHGHPSLTASERNPSLTRRNR